MDSMRVWVDGPHPIVERLRLDLKTAGFVVAQDFVSYYAIIKPGAGLTIHGPKGRLTELVVDNVIELAQTATLGREGNDRSVTIVCGEKGQAETAAKAILRAFEVLRSEMDAAPPPATPKEKLLGIDVAWLSKLVWLWLLVAPSAYAQSGANPMIPVYDEGIFQGVAFSLNCAGAGITCTLSGGRFTFTVDGTGGTPGGSDTQVQFNDGGAFGGDAGFVYDDATDTATVGTIGLFDTSGSNTLTLTGGNHTANQTLEAAASASTVTLNVAGASTIMFTFNKTLRTVIGGASQPAYASASHGTTGIYFDGFGAMYGSVLGTTVYGVGSSGFVIDDSVQLASSTDPLNAAPDVGFLRLAAGVWKTTNGSSGSGWVQNTAGRKRVTSTISQSTTTFANIADLTFTLTAGRKYSGKMELIVSQTTSADGLKIDFDGGTATATNFTLVCSTGQLGSTAVTYSASTALATDLTFATMATSGRLDCMIDFVVNGAGTFIPRYALNSGSTGPIAIYIGSWLWLEDMP